MTRPCICCFRHTSHPDGICVLCLPLIHQIQAANSLSTYEAAALKIAVEDVAPLVEANGTDLAEWDDNQVTEFAGAIVKGFGAGLRKLIGEREIPF